MSPYERYRNAVRELLEAHVALSAADAREQRSGFGDFPQLIQLRHATACPDLAGDVSDAIRAALDGQPPSHWLKGC